MTEQEKQALSQAVADKYGIEAKAVDSTRTYQGKIFTTWLWLHDEYEAVRIAICRALLEKEI